MRYYKIAITKHGQTEVWQSSSLPASVKDASYTSVINGSPNSSALDIVIDLPVFTYDLPRQGGRIRIYGVDIREVAQDTDLQGATISIWAGMTKGDFPLSLQYLPDLLVKGTIWQSSGNWVGNQTFIDFTIVPLIADSIDPKSFVGQPLTFNWSPGFDFVGAIRQMVDGTYGAGAYTVKGKVSDDLQTPGQVLHQAQNLSEMGDWIRKYTNGTLPGSPFSSLKGVNGSPYYGVQFLTQDKTIYVSDAAQNESPTGGSSVDKPKQIVFNDLIGQPAWKNAYTISIITMMRGDIQCLDFVKLPTELQQPYTTTPNPKAAGIAAIQTPSRDKSVFQGVWRVQEMHHNGRFRQATGEAWTTAFDLFALTKQDAPPVQQGTTL